MLSTSQNYNTANRNCVKYNLRFYFCPCFWKKKIFFSLNHPLLTLSYWPSVSITVKTKLKQLGTWYIRQCSTMSNRAIQSKETNSIFKMTMFCDEEDTNHIWSSQWMKWKKVIKITRKYVPWQCICSLINVTFSCPCAHHEGICEREGTTPHIINPVLLHTMPSDNILATILSMLTFLPLHISLAIKLNSWFFHSLHI